ncbi:MAG: tetratricopeptide repeat protein, partial [Spirochaetota bacterium]
MRGSIPAEAVSVYNNALEMSNKGDFPTALNEYGKAIAIFPKFLEAYNNIGEIYSKLGDGDRAISTYLQALNIERNYRVLLNLGVEYYNKGQNLPALKHFEEAIAVKDDFVEGHFYAGMAYFNIKDYIKAEEHFRKVTTFDKNHVKANYLLSYI